jgi:hypothetical protein
MATAVVAESRTIYMNSALGRRQFREVLGGLLVGVTLAPDDVWLVSPWISDFDLLDNRSNNWSMIQPSWGSRVIRFSEVLKELVETGSTLTVVTSSDGGSAAFLKRLDEAVAERTSFRVGVCEDLHIKGLLTSSFFLAGSMNFTFSGTNVNDEQVQLSSDSNLIAETRLEYEQRYLGVVR